MKINETKHDHEHCWHAYHGAIHMVIPDGYIAQKCCECESHRTVHADHIADKQRAIRRADYSSYFAPMGQYVKWDT